MVRGRERRAGVAASGAPAAVRIDERTGWAWCGERRLDLSPKAFAVLRHLVGHPLALVTKDDLFAAGWGDVVVGEATRTSCIRDLRKALRDASRTPRYIETVHRRGFRFIGPVAALEAPASAPPVAGPPAAVTPSATVPALVGRERERARLHALLATAASGRRRLVFVSGEAGIGKTTLVEAFLGELDGGAVRIGRGQCLERFGASEPYLPILEALGRLGRARGNEALLATLRQYAPTWLAQLPALLDDAELEAVQRRAQGATRERMLRELVEAVDALAAETPFILLLEDLHWGDVDTVDVLAMLARRRDAARLLIVATHRDAELAGDAHPLGAVKRELLLHDTADDLALAFLDEAAVAAYLEHRFGTAAFPRDLAPVLHANTSGNPLFLVNVVDDLVSQGHLRVDEGGATLVVPVERIAAGVPRTLVQMVEQQIDRLAPAERAMLAVASVAGAEFSAALSETDGIAASEGERHCAEMARRGRFVRATGATEWPDGTVAGRFAFIHALYRTVLYERIPAGHRLGLHLRIGDRLERAHGTRAPEIAGELAMHFEEGRDFARAIHYRRLAAETALRQNAHRQAIEHATRALGLLEALPPSADRAGHELVLQTLLGAVHIANSGWAAPDVSRAYARARELCAETGITPQLFPVLLAVAGALIMRGELAVADEVSRQLLVVAEATYDEAALLGGHNAAGMIAFYRGDFTTALTHLERSKAIYDPARHAPNPRDGFTVDHDPGVSCFSHEALALFMLGRFAESAARMRACLAHARALDHPLSVAMGYNFAATLHQMRREPDVVQGLEDVRLEYSNRHDFALFLMLGEIYRGWLLAERGALEDGAARMRQGLAVCQAVGAELGRPTFLGMLAEVSTARWPRNGIQPRRTLCATTPKSRDPKNGSVESATPMSATEFPCGPRSGPSRENQNERVTSSASAGIVTSWTSTNWFSTYPQLSSERPPTRAANRPVRTIAVVVPASEPSTMSTPPHPLQGAPPLSKPPFWSSSCATASAASEPVPITMSRSAATDRIVRRTALVAGTVMRRDLIAGRTVRS